MRFSAISSIVSDGSVRFSNLTPEHLSVLQKDRMLKDRVRKNEMDIWEISSVGDSENDIDTLMFRLFEVGVIFYEDFKQTESPADYMRTAQKEGRFSHSFVSIGSRKYLTLNVPDRERISLTYG